MANQITPDDPKKFTMIAFLAFVVVFVVAMIMMLVHGNYERTANGETQYNTQVNEPSGD